MKFKVQRIQPLGWAIEVKGRHLSPFSYQFDNLNEVEEMCAQNCISWEDLIVDDRTGLVTIPGVGAVGIGQYLVDGGGSGLEAYDSLDALQSHYKIVEG